ncbi:MAG: hypothetical protein AB3N63_12260 [Puniceicoccaceae bacterium]
MKFLLRFWYVILLAFVLSLVSAAGMLYLQMDTWVVEQQAIAQEEEPVDEIPGMSEEYTRWSYGIAGIEDLRVKLEAEKEELQKERQELDAYKRQVDAEAEELKVLRQDIEDLRDSINVEFIKIEANEEDNLKRLAKVYSEMKPDAAVAIFSGLELNLVVKILSEMKEESASRILSEMSKGDADSIEAKKAAKITEMIQRVM